MQPHFERPSLTYRLWDGGHVGLVVLRTVTESLLIILRYLPIFGPRHGVPKIPVSNHQTGGRRHGTLQLDQTSLRRLFEVGMARMVSESTRGLQRDTRAGGRKQHSVLAAFKKPTQSRRIKMSVACRRASFWWPRLRRAKGLLALQSPLADPIFLPQKSRCSMPGEITVSVEARSSLVVRIFGSPQPLRQCVRQENPTPSCSRWLVGRAIGGKRLGQSLGQNIALACLDARGRWVGPAMRLCVGKRHGRGGRVLGVGRGFESGKRTARLGRHQRRKWPTNIWKAVGQPISRGIDGVVDEKKKKRLVNEGKRVHRPLCAKEGICGAHGEGRPIPNRAPTGSGHRLGVRRSFRGAGLVIRLGVPSRIEPVKTCFLNICST